MRREMSDPAFIYEITKDYTNMIKLAAEQEENRLKLKAHGEAVLDGPELDGLEMIVDTDKLFNILAPALEASSYNSLVVSGLPGSGKTHLAKQLALPLIRMGYYPLYLSGMNMIQSAELPDQVPPGTKKICIVVDDASFVLSAVSGKTGAKNKNWWSMVRHAFGGAEVLVIWLIHQLQAIPPLLRNSNCFIMSAPTQIEYDSCLKLVGTKDRAVKNQFDRIFGSVRKIQAEGLKKKDIEITLGNKKYPFRWAYKGDPEADGRIMLAIINNRPYYFLSGNENTSEIDHIFVPKVDIKDYKPTKGESPSEREDSNDNNTEENNNEEDSNNNGV